MKEISLHILDLVQNSIRANASIIELTVEEDTGKKDFLKVALKDNGCGMSKEMAEAVKNPFVTTRTTRKVGLGIPMFKTGCEMCGGSFSIESEEGVGTYLEGIYRHSHIDRPPLGDMADTMLLLIISNQQTRFVYTHKVNGEEYTLDTDELKRILGGDIPLDDPDVTGFIKDFLVNNETELYGGM
ncbi:MAG: sensor histidine kinase [Clostridia bacterium]|nr:sensor histidine kinase [Clostridia bacterium]